MNLHELIASARALTSPPPAAAEEYASHHGEFAAEVSRRLLARPDLDRLIGHGNTAMMEDNHRNHGRFMESIFRHYQPETLVETVFWVYRAYPAHGFHMTYWPAQLNTWIEVLRTGLSPTAFAAIYPFYNWLLINQAAFVALAAAPAQPVQKID